MIMRLSTAFFGVIIAFGFAACATKRQTVAQAESLTEVHTERVEVHDTIHRVDTIIEREQVVVRPADSLTMAQYGVQLQAGQTAWLVERDRLRKEIDRLTESRAQNVERKDTVTQYFETIREVEVEVERKPTFWQQLRNAAVAFFVILLLVWICGRKKD